MKNLNGRVAVVTGAASGIGLGMAKQFAGEGMKLVLADIEVASLASVLAELRAGGATAIGVPTDVSSEAQVKALADAAYAEYGAVHVLCNNAGVATPALRTLAWDSPLTDWDWIHKVNFMGVLYGVRAFVPRMLAGGDEGHVVNTASVAGLVTGGNPYFVYKHAVSCFTEGLYKDLKGLGAKVSASVLCPGLIRTSILDAERNRPAEFGPATDVRTLAPKVRAMAEQFEAALDAGFEASYVAEAVVAAIRQDQYYIIPAQPGLLDLVDLRMQDILARRNPSVPAPLA
jgi:NAD(P)-dependent dehydrogenase (short-subunit alcohol dehydrogenase family)